MRVLDGSPIELSDAQLTEFKARLRGELITPRSSHYDDARSLWNAMIDRRPALIARCAGTADVVEAVRFAKEHALLNSVKAGGHNIAGQAICEDGLVIDLSGMNGVWVDPAGRRGRAQAGCTLGCIDRETQLHGLAAVLGFVSTTGAAGVTVGGGFGYLTRKYGWTCDSLRAVEVVTADGEVRAASKSENADLFWAICGGGGNFGVVTSFEYDLYPWVRASWRVCSAHSLDHGRPSMRTMLVVFHSLTGGTRQMVEAATRGAAAQADIQIRLLEASKAESADVLQADGYIFATPENLAAMAGIMKDFFDRTYYPALDRINGRPYAIMVCAGSDGQSAVRQIERIATGWRLRPIADPIIVCTHAQTPEAIFAPKTMLLPLGSRPAAAFRRVRSCRTSSHRSSARSLRRRFCTRLRAERQTLASPRVLQRTDTAITHRANTAWSPA